jgi:hypothetical protein
MTRRVARVAATLTVGAVASAALYWAFLNTPESNALMLALSALLIIATVGAIGLTANAAILIARDHALSAALRRAVRGLGWFALVATPLLLAILAVWRFDAWLAGREGEVHAWFIARLGWTDPSPLLQAEVWISRWMRVVMFPLLATSLLAALLDGEHARRTAWLKRAFRLRTLALATAAFVILLVWPWALTTWRPDLPATWVEAAVAALRLAMVFVAGVAGATTITILAAGPDARALNIDQLSD